MRASRARACPPPTGLQRHGGNERRGRLRQTADREDHHGRAAGHHLLGAMTVREYLETGGKEPEDDVPELYLAAVAGEP
jgi:hypothetical protein